MICEGSCLCGISVPVQESMETGVPSDGRFGARKLAQVQSLQEKWKKSMMGTLQGYSALRESLHT